MKKQPFQDGAMSPSVGWREKEKPLETEVKTLIKFFLIEYLAGL